MIEKQRNDEVDIIRMIALIGICIVNVPFMAQPLEAAFRAPELWYDRLTAFAVEGLFQLKFFLLFSFIFGWGMSVQAKSAERAGRSFSRRFFRRMGGLAIIGVLHATLVFNGDILVLYALLGVLLWLIRGLSPRALLRFAATMIPLSTLCLTILAVLIGAAMKNGSLEFPIDGPSLGGGFFEATQARINNWPATFVFLVFVQAPLAMGAFACGLAAAQSDFFTLGSREFQRLGRAVPGLLLVAIPCNLLYAATTSEMIPRSNELLGLLGFVSISLGGPALSAVYLYLIIRMTSGLRMPKMLVLAGRNSLSTYVLQGIIAGLLFGGYGMGLFGQFGLLALIPIAFAIALVAMLLVGVYATIFGRGPLEPVLRWISG